MIKKARLRTNQPSVSAIIGSIDTGVMQQLELLQDIGDELAERNQWQSLNISGSIKGDGGTTVWPIPVGTLITEDFNTDFGPGPSLSSGVSDFGGSTLESATPDFGGLSNGLKFISSLFPLQPLVGPVTNEQMNALKAFPLGLLRPVWRIVDNFFEFWPALAVGEVAMYNYYSTNWIQPVTGPRILAFAADTDISLIDEKILTSGLEWRWLAAKGLDYAEAFRRYERRIALADGRQDTTREVSMSRRRVGPASTWPAAIPQYDGSDTESNDFGFS